MIATSSTLTPKMIRRCQGGSVSIDRTDGASGGKAFADAGFENILEGRWGEARPVSIRVWGRQGRWPGARRVSKTPRSGHKMTTLVSGPTVQ